MNRLSLPTNEILVEDRFRQDLGDIDGLADSISRVGLIQPIVINHQKRLIAGGRRLAAHIKLGLPNIDVVYRETLNADELHEMELEENVRRKDMSWQERCLLVAQIHQLKQRRGILEGRQWGMRETGELMGVSKSHIGYTLTVAKWLSDKEHPAWKSDSMADAWKEFYMKPNEEAARAELAKRQQELSADASVMGLFGIPDDLKGNGLTPLQVQNGEGIDLPDPLQDARDRYLANPLNPRDGFDAYWAERQKLLSKPENIIRLSPSFHLATDKDWVIRFMFEYKGMFDHIITDPPYAIDMDMLNQNNPHGGMQGLEDILDAHEVDYNLDLLAKFFPAAYTTLKEDGFCVLWCDVMQWQYLYDLAIKAGFKVQRWPLTWCKLHRCMNQTAQYNFTKDTEIAMVCRKGKAVLVEPALTCRIAASNEDAKRVFGHPFAKPFEVWEFIAKYVSFEGQLILDPFVGRGSCAIAMLRMNRRVMGVELEKNHYDALLENLKRYYLTLNPSFVFL